MSTSNAPLLVAPADLRKAPSGTVSFLDATWFMPNSPRKGQDEFASKHIPGAQYLDLDEVASPHDLGLKHMMPEARVFADACANFGIKPTSHVVLYDTHGVFSSPRALFMFRAFGHNNSSVLNGGLPRWESEGHPVEDTPPRAAEKASYPVPTLHSGIIRSYEQMVSNSCLSPSDSQAAIVLDARPRGRYIGTDPEPRPGLPSGHIPNSLSLPFNIFLQKHAGSGSTEYTTLLPPPALHKALVDAIGAEKAALVISGQKPIITSCGSGMTAGVLWLALRLLGNPQISLYDESWTGYAARESSPIAKGAETA